MRKQLADCHSRADRHSIASQIASDDSVKWDAALSDEKIDHLIAGMGIADMDFRTAPAVMERLRKAVQYDNWGYIDMGTPGRQAWLDSIVAWNRKRYGITVMTRENMEICTGVLSGLYATLRAFAPAGTKVLMATPNYYGFYETIKSARLVPSESLMKYVNGRYEIDWADFESKASHPDTKVSILCNPHNPGGRVWTREELTRYGEICLKHKVLVLADEIHCDFINKGHKYVPFSSLENKDIVNNSITYQSVSKSFSLAGMCCAWFFSTNPEVFKATVFNNVGDMNSLGMYAAEGAYAGGESWLNECVSYISDNHDFANDYIKRNIPLIKVGRVPEGTYFQWLDVTALADKIGAKKLADDANQKARDAGPKMSTSYSGRQALVKEPMQTPEKMVQHWVAKNAFVQIYSGSSYGLGGENHMRMNIATSRKTLTAALDSLAASLKKLT